MEVCHVLVHGNGTIRRLVGTSMIFLFDKNVGNMENHCLLD